jgi:hypothetical protein
MRGIGELVAYTGEGPCTLRLTESLSLAIGLAKINRWS